MTKEKKKTIIITVILAIVALALIAIFVVGELKKSGVITSKEDRAVLSEFYKNFESKERTIIYYASTGCGYCELQAPILEEIADEYDLEYYKIDAANLATNQRKEILNKLGIEHATPTTIVVENGKVIDTAVGYKEGSALVDFFIDTEILPSDAEYPGEKNITFVDFKKYEELIYENKTNIVVIGASSCSNCIAFKPTINEVADEYDIVINYLDLDKVTQDEKQSFYTSLDNLGYDDPDYLNDGSFGTPTILIVENGKIKDYVIGRRTISQLVREFTKLGLISE